MWPVRIMPPVKEHCHCLSACPSAPWTVSSWWTGNPRSTLPHPDAGEGPQSALWKLDEKNKSGQGCGREEGAESPRLCRHGGIDGTSLILFERTAPKIKNYYNPIPCGRIRDPQRAGDPPGILMQLGVRSEFESRLPGLYSVLLPPGLCQERRLSSVVSPLLLACLLPQKRGQTPSRPSPGPGPPQGQAAQRGVSRDPLKQGGVPSFLTSLNQVRGSQRRGTPRQPQRRIALLVS